MLTTTTNCNRGRRAALSGGQEGPGARIARRVSPTRPLWAPRPAGGAGDAHGPRPAPCTVPPGGSSRGDLAWLLRRPHRPLSPPSTAGLDVLEAGPRRGVGPREHRSVRAQLGETLRVMAAAGLRLPPSMPACLSVSASASPSVAVCLSVSPCRRSPSLSVSTSVSVSISASH